MNKGTVSHGTKKNKRKKEDTKSTRGIVQTAKRKRRTANSVSDVIELIEQSVFCKGGITVETRVGITETTVIMKGIRTIRARELETLIEMCGGLATHLDVMLVSSRINITLLHLNARVYTVPSRLTSWTTIALASIMPSNIRVDNLYVMRFPSNMKMRRPLPDCFGTKLLEMINHDTHSTTDLARICIPAAYMYNYRSVAETPSKATIHVTYEKKKQHYVLTATLVYSISIDDIRGLIAFFQPIYSMRIVPMSTSIEVVIPRSIQIHRAITSPFISKPIT